jgi:UDP-N-acetyl-D-glucosamine dehydrogenase
MPHHVVGLVQNALNSQKKAVNGSRIHVLGVAYKRNIDDMRESPALDIIHLLDQQGGLVSYTDPFVPEIRFDGLTLRSTPMEEALSVCDCVVIVTDHDTFDYVEVVRRAPVVVDTRNALKGHSASNIVHL